MWHGPCWQGTGYFYPIQESNAENEEVRMSVFTSKSRILPAVLFALVLGLAMPVTSFAQGWGRGRKQDKWEKKCDKFVNCHDARDGRWDGRGPNRARFNDRFDDRFDRNRFDDRFDRNRRFRNRDFDNDYRRFQQRRIRNYRYYNRGDYRYYNYNNDYNNRYDPYRFQQGGILNSLLNLFQ
jgi:hypothetical protein